MSELQGGLVYGTNLNDPTLNNLLVNASRVNNVSVSAPVSAESITLPAATSTANVNYLWYLFGVLVLLAIMKYASEHEKRGFDPQFLGIGVWNFFSVGILAMLFLVTGKAIFNKYPVPGVTGLFNAA